MVNPQLLDFIKQQIDKGINKEEIKKMLLANGWTSQDVEEGFNVVNPSFQAPQPPFVAPVPENRMATANFYGYAGFWKRWAALIIDNIILMAVGAVVFVPISIIGEKTSNKGVFTIVFFALYITFFFIHWLYYALMERSSWRATLGKKILGIIVTDLNGNKISFGRATGRYFGKILSALILSIGFLMTGFTAKKQALHDKLSGCLVVNKAEPTKGKKILTVIVIALVVAVPILAIIGTVSIVSLNLNKARQINLDNFKSKISEVENVGGILNNGKETVNTRPIDKVEEASFMVFNVESSDTIFSLPRFLDNEKGVIAQGQVVSGSLRKGLMTTINGKESKINFIKNKGRYVESAALREEVIIGLVNLTPDDIPENNKIIYFEGK